MLEWFFLVLALGDAEQAAAPVRFFLYPPQFERDGILSLWYGQLYEELLNHPWRTTSAEQASVFFLGIDVSCAYLWPVYSAPVPGSVNYEQKGRWGTLGDSRTCRETRQSRLEAYVRNGWATYWGAAGKQHVVFDQLCHNPVSEIVHGDHLVTLAGAGHLKGRAYGYRRGIDIAWPEMPVTVERPEVSDCSCSPRKRLVSFQGAETRTVRQKLRALHDGHDIVIHVVDVSKSSLNTTDARWNISHPIKAGYASLMRESEFALAPAGHSPCSLRLYEIMSFCTIPVILSDEKLLPFSEILNWSEMAVVLPERAAATVPKVLRGMDHDQRCKMRKRAYEVFHSYFANVSANVHGLLEVLTLYSKEGLRANEDSRKLASDFREQASGLIWSPHAMEDIRRHRHALHWLPAVPASLPTEGDCLISWREVTAYSDAAHSESMAALATWALAAVDIGGRPSLQQLKSLGLQAKSGTWESDSDLLKQMDASGDGVLDLPEVLASPSQASFEALVQAALASRDRDRDGKLSVGEFEVQVPETIFPLQFSKLDSNNDSFIALRELLAEPMLKTEWEDALRRGFDFADINRDDRLSGRELERREALPILHMLAEYPTSTRGRVADVREAGRLCAGVRSAQTPTDQLARELRECGYIHVHPGWLDLDYVATMLEASRDLPCEDVPAPFDGPFEKSLPFTAPRMRLWDLVKAAVATSRCCDLVSLSLQCFTCTDEPNATELPWRGPDVVAQNRYTVLVALQAVPPVLGFIPEMKHDKFVADERNSFCGGVSGTGRERLRVRDGYAASFMAAGTVLVYDANLVKRPFCIKDKTWFLRYDIVAGMRDDLLSSLRQLHGVSQSSGLELQRQEALHQVMSAADDRSNAEL